MPCRPVVVVSPDVPTRVRTHDADADAMGWGAWFPIDVSKFGDTLPSESACPGDGDGNADVVSKLSDSQRVVDAGSFNNSSSKPLRRAQIFDKGVDASMMQVGAYV